jgi:hypothetical protein
MSGWNTCHCLLQMLWLYMCTISKKCKTSATRVTCSIYVFILQNGISQTGSLVSEASGSTHNLVPVHLQQQQVVQPQLQQPRTSYSNSNLFLNHAVVAPSFDGAYRESQRGTGVCRDSVDALPLTGTGIISMGGDGLGRHIVNRACGYSNGDEQCSRHLNNPPNQGWGSKSGQLRDYDGIKRLSGVDGVGVAKEHDNKTQRISHSFSGDDLGVMLHRQSHGHCHGSKGGFKGLSSIVGGFSENRSYQNSNGRGGDGEHLHRHLVISNPNSEDDDI